MRSRHPLGIAPRGGRGVAQYDEKGELKPVIVVRLFSSNVIDLCINKNYGKLEI